MNANNNWAPLAGRIFLVLVFLLSGLGKISGYEGTAGYMVSKGMPMVGLLLPLTILLEVAASLLIAVGFLTRWASLALIGFTLIASLVFHDFWASPADQQQLQMIMFMKNLGLMGGLGLLAAYGPGQWSIEASKKRRAAA